MPGMIQRISQLVSRLFAGGAAGTILALFLIVFINSVRRYLFGRSFEWGEELPVFLAIYGIMFGTAWAYMEDRHIRFTMLVGFLPEAVTRKMYMLVDMVMTVTGIMLAYSGWQFVLKRGGMEASGLINLAKDLKGFTGWESMIWLGYFYPYQTAMVLGGIMLTVAALLRLCNRYYDDMPAQTAAR